MNTSISKDNFLTTTRDESGLKAGGVLTALEKFSTLFSVRLGQLLFSAADEVSTVIAIEGLERTRGREQCGHTFKYRRQRTDDAFKTFYASTVEKARCKHR